MSAEGSGSRVIKNTGILYLRMFITIGISLYTTRLVLNGLGVTDYGIYALVSGIIVMLSFLNSALSTSTQRYLSFYQGKNDLVMQRTVFGNSLLLHILIGITIVIALEIGGLFLFNGFLNIPPDRLPTATIIYHFMSVTVFFSFITVPFSGLLIAHENMLLGAIVNIVEVCLRLVIALLLYVISGDKLIFYGCTMAVVSVVSLILYMIFCLKKYDECSLYIFRNVKKEMMKELTAFAGWNLFGAACGVSRTQGMAIILNLFFGSAINAAYGIANQVSAQLNFFSATMLQALNPQIMKSEGAGDRDRMLRLSMMASKFGFFLLAILAIPCIFEMPIILEIWLKHVPDNTVIFCRLILVGIMANQLTIGLQSAVQATGNIKNYQIGVGSFLLLNVPVGYGLLWLGYPAYSLLISFIVIELIACTFRLLFIKALAGLSITEYIKKVFFREVIPVVINVLVCYCSISLVEVRFRFIITIFVSVSSFIASIYFFGLEKSEKDYGLLLLKKVIRKE